VKKERRWGQARLRCRFGNLSKEGEGLIEVNKWSEDGCRWFRRKPEISMEFCSRYIPSNRLL
jgi:hypothetical protein